MFNNSEEMQLICEKIFTILPKFLAFAEKLVEELLVRRNICRLGIQICEKVDRLFWCGLCAADFIVEKLLGVFVGKPIEERNGAELNGRVACKRDGMRRVLQRSSERLD